MSLQSQSPNGEVLLSLGGMELENEKIPPKPWSWQQETILIEFWKAHPCLWQLDHPDKHDKQVNNDLMDELQVYLEHEFTVKEIKMKWRKLKDTFDRSLRRARQTNGLHGTGWHHFERMLIFVSGSSNKETSGSLFDSGAADDADDLPTSDTDANVDSKPVISSANLFRTQQSPLVAQSPTLTSSEGESSGRHVITSSVDVSVYCDAMLNEHRPPEKSNMVGGGESPEKPSAQPSSAVKRDVTVGNKRHAAQQHENNTDNESNDAEVYSKRHRGQPRTVRSYNQAPPLFPQRFNQRVYAETAGCGDEYFIKHVHSSLQGLPFLLRERAKLDIQQVLYKYISEHHNTEQLDL